MSSAVASSPITTFLDALTAAGSRVKQSGGHQWTATCPNTAAHSHGDKSPSLSIGESPSGKVLVTCHAGCTLPEVTAALALTMRDLFPKTESTHANERRQSMYHYPDEDGELLYRVVKTKTADGTKTFKAQRQSPETGRWVDGIGDVRRVLYNLPAVVAAVRDGRPVILCEGEKDAEAAAWAFARLHAAATTVPFGAGKWDPSYGETLRGAHVIQIGDDDAKGHEHLDVVRIQLSGVAASVVQWLPALGFNDLSEHLGAGRSIEELRPFGASSVEHVEASPFVDWPRLWARDRSARDWMAEPLIPKGRNVALYAPAKTGKSLVLLDVAVAVATGRAVLGGAPAERAHVLYLDYEMTEDDLHERLEDMGYGPDDDLSWFHYCLLPSLPPLDTAEGGRALLALAQSCGASLVVVDTLGRAVDGKENDADTLRSYHRHTGLLLKAHGITTTRSDHSGKDLERGQRGTSAKNDDVDVVWLLTPASGSTFKLSRTHSRVSWVPRDVLLTREDDPLRFVAVTGTGYAEGADRLADALDALQLPLDVSRPKARAALKAAQITAATNRLIDALRLRRERADDPSTWSNLSADRLSELHDAEHSDSSSAPIGHTSSEGSDNQTDRVGQAVEAPCPPDPPSKGGGQPGHGHDDEGWSMIFGDDA